MIKQKVRKLLRAFSKASPRTTRSCPLCSWKGRQFGPGGDSNKIRLDSRCPQCGALERQRLAYMVANSQAHLDYSHVLHVAPEPQIEKFLRSRTADYLSIDLSAKAIAKMDITSLDLESNSRTLVWISHVLEHVERDDLAISEIHRVLRPSGVAFVQVPIWREKTFEDPSIKTAEERQKAFYQSDHVRLYGLDIADRFKQTGFEATVIRAQDFGPEKLIEHQLSFASTNEVFIFKKH